jgi:hypothetical protein
MPYEIDAMLVMADAEIKDADGVRIPSCTCSSTPHMLYLLPFPIDNK